MGHCSSYDEMRTVDTSIALEMLAKAEELGTVIPSNIVPGPFVQLAADNNDLNEETLDGKNTTHATTMVVFQRKSFGPFQPQSPIADQRDRRRSLQSSSTIYEIQECSAHGRRPAVSAYVENGSPEWYVGENEVFRKTSYNDVIWALLRLNPTSLRQPLITEEEKQSVPGWSGFNALLYPDMPRQSNIGYCPMIDGCSTELKHAQLISASLGQEDTVITFDLLIYMKAKQIQWRFPNEISDVVIRMGGFHIALNFLSVVGKKYLNSGLDDLLIESGVYAAGSTSALLKGKSYNRGVRAHKLTMEALFRLMWRSFVQWYNSSYAERRNNEEDVLQKIADGVSDVKNKSDVRQRVEDLEGDLTGLTCDFEEFKSKASVKSKMFVFWESYGDMINVLLQFIKAERTGNWELHLSSVAMDRPNYARWLPVYLADMNQLERKHPLVYRSLLEEIILSAVQDNRFHRCRPTWRWNSLLMLIQREWEE
ncbi:hypothetical protein QZH41_000040 [Actinostola sp. cb2023]|nr:hypothetical protein QZH41_000040 [Actinostola sp. cb2023]